MAQGPVIVMTKASFINAILALSVVGTAGLVEKSVAQNTAPKDVHSAKTFRLVSFAPSCTELVESINAQHSLVGICKFCQVPAGPSLKVERVGDFNTANIERLTRLKPDMVLVVSGQEALLHTLKNSKFEVRSFPNSSLGDISQNLLELGKLTNHDHEAVQKAQEFDRAIEELRKICANPKQIPSVFFCVWPQPLMTVGKYSFLNDALRACGGKNVASGLNSAYPHFSLEQIVLINPDVVIMPYEAKSAEYMKRPPWNTLKAFKQNRLFFLEKEESDRLSRPSTRVVTGLYWLAIRLHPEKQSQLTSWLKRNKGLEKLN
jgi:iron complex transport system substrate-binding protein